MVVRLIVMATAAEGAAEAGLYQGSCGFAMIWIFCCCLAFLKAPHVFLAVTHLQLLRGASLQTLTVALPREMTLSSALGSGAPLSFSSTGGTCRGLRAPPT